MKKVIYILLFLSMSLLNANLQGQDLHFSQFPYSPMNLGPAQAGMMDGDLRIAGLHRRQWASVTVPYKTFSLSADAKLSALNEKLKGLCAGLLVNQDKAGDGALQTLQVNLDLAYMFSIGSDSVHFLSIGINGGFTQKNLDVNKLNFDNQFNGDFYIPGSPNGESFDRTSYTYPDFGVGAAWKSVFEKTTWHAGFQIQHLNRADLSYYSFEKVRLPILSQLTAGTDISLNQRVILLPAINYMMQDKFRELNFGSEVKLILRNEPAKQYAVGIGLFYRTSDAFIPMASIYYNKFRFGFSYDINISPLKTASNYRGGPEFTVIYIAKKLKSESKRRIICPLY